MEIREQICKSCKESKPYFEFGFSEKNNKYFTKCKDCSRKSYRRWYVKPNFSSKKHPWTFTHPSKKKAPDDN